MHVIILFSPQTQSPPECRARQERSAASPSSPSPWTSSSEVAEPGRTWIQVPEAELEDRYAMVELQISENSLV